MRIPSLLLSTLLLAQAAFGAGEPIDPAQYQPPIRVACLGDSITHGVGADAGWAWPDQLDRMLGAQWDVRNFGHSGATVAKEDKHSIWTQEEFRGAVAFHPDVTVILLGTNDSKPDNWAHASEFPKLYRELIRSFQKLSSHPRIYCGTPPYVAKKGNFGINEPVVLEEIPIIQKAAEELQAGVVEVHAATQGHDELYKDNVHPSTEGATLIAKAVYRALTGKEWAGEIPSPTAVQKEKRTVREVKNPGDLSYRDLYTLIVTEGGLAPEQLAPVHEMYERTSPEVDAALKALEDRIHEAETLRMKYKHTKEETEKPLYGEYRAKGAALQKDLAAYRQTANAALLAAVPPEQAAGVGAARLKKYVLDRLEPIATTLTPEQRGRVQAACAKAGAAYAKMSNTPERSLAELETYESVYREALTPEQQKRVEPK